MIRQLKGKHIIKTPSYLFNNHLLMAQFTLVYAENKREDGGDLCPLPTTAVSSPRRMAIPPLGDR